jgi:cytochrome c
MNRVSGISIKKRLMSAGVFILLFAGTSVFGQNAAGDAASGKEAFESNCLGCHNADSEVAKMGPGLKGLFKHEKLHNGKKLTEASILELINGGGGGMPSFADKLTDDEKSNVIAYLKTL